VYAPYLAGALIGFYIAFETSLSGMSTNPARTFASALHAGYWQALWIYFVAPTLGMLLAGESFLRTRGGVAENSTTPTTIAASFITRPCGAS